MKQFLRRLRGIIGTGLTWALGWAGSVFVLAGLFGLRWDVIFWAMRNAAITGFIAGGSFGVVLGVLERHKKFEDLSLWRISLWGGLGGLVLAGLLALLGGVQYWPEAAAFTVYGIGSATGTVALARRGSDTKLLEGDDEPLPALEGE